MIRFIVNNKMEQILLKMSLIKERCLSFLAILSHQHNLSKHSFGKSSPYETNEALHQINKNLIKNRSYAVE